MDHDPRIVLVDTVAEALRTGVPLMDGNVDILRSEPIWEAEELPLLLVDLVNEGSQEDTRSPRYYRKTLSIIILAYIRGPENRNGRRILEVTDQIEKVMREWQSITESDVDPAVPADGREDYIIDEIAAGDTVIWFKSSNTSIPHSAVALEYRALYMADGNATGEAVPGAPSRNVLGDERQVNTEWNPLRSGGLTMSSETHLEE